MPAHNKLSIEDFINRSKNIHNDLYDYSLVKYVNNTTKIKIICSEHGVFEQTPKNHLKGSGCKKCGKIKCINSRKITTKEFISKSKQIHNDKYDYSNVVINGVRNKVKITCSIHGEFNQEAYKHLSGHGCKRCTIIDNPHFIKMSNEEFVSKSKKVHGNIYNYDNSIYNGSKELIEIKCEKHGIFQQLAGVHMAGHGCPFCSQSKGEREISKTLKSLNINFVEQKKFNKCLNEKTGRVLKFDFYLPELNLLIEYDGEQHFKPIDFFGGQKELVKRQKLDKIKNRYANDNGFKLLRIPYYEKESISKIIQQIVE